LTTWSSFCSASTVARHSGTVQRAIAALLSATRSVVANWECVGADLVPFRAADP
jgi:hypothetical protein